MIRRPGALLVAALLVPIALLSLPSVSAQAPLVVADPEGVHLRGGPGTQFVSLALIPQGTELPALGAVIDGRWMPTSYQGQLGFVANDFLRPRAEAAPRGAAVPASPTPAPAQSTVMRVTPSDGVNLRTEPNTTARVVLVIPANAQLTVEGRSADGTWLQVRFGGQTGWVSAQYLAPAAAPAATSSPSRYIWPVTGRSITSSFGPGQLGIDIDQYPSGGNPVVAAAGGRVTFAGGDPCCSYGLYVTVEHADGTETLYAHLQSVDVREGQTVAQGQLLGKSGNTGRSTGAHLHFEMRIDGTVVDPLPYLPP